MLKNEKKEIMKNIGISVALGLVLMGAMTMSGCKLSTGKTVDELMEEFGQVHLGNKDNENNYVIGSGQTSVWPVEKLTIDWMYDSVTIVAHDQNGVEFSETADKPLNDSTMMYYSFGHDGELNITFGKPGIKLDKKDLPHKRLIVRVPRTYKLDEIVINGVGHTFRMDSVPCEHLELNNVANQIVLNECEVKEIEVNSVSSDVEATFSRMPEDIELNNVSGKTVLYVPKDAGMTVEMAGINDDFYSELPVGKKGGKKVIGNGACNIECNSLSGDLKIKNKKSN